MEKETKRSSGNAAGPLFHELSLLSSHDEIVSTRSHIAIGKKLISYGGNTDWTTMWGRDTHLKRKGWLGLICFLCIRRTSDMKMQ